MAGNTTVEQRPVNARDRELTGRSLPRWAVISAVFVLVLAAALRLVVFLDVIGPGNPAAWRTSDTTSYESMAVSFLEARNFQVGHEDVRVHALHRPPGYPLYLALCYAIAGAQAGQVLALFGQVLLSVLMVAVLMWTAWCLVGRAWVALVAGGAAALSITAIFVPCTLMADFLFSFCLLLSIGLCFWPRRLAEGFRAGLYASVLLLAMYLKPGLSYYLPVCLLWWAAGVFHRGRRCRIAWFLLIVVIQLVGWGAWTARNAKVEGVRAFSLIGSFTIANYLAVQVESAVTSEDISVLKTKRMNATTEGYRANPEAKASVAEADRKRSKHWFSEQPRLSLQCFWQNVRDNVAAPWTMLRSQLGFAEGQGAWLDRLDARLGRLRATLLWWSPILLVPAGIAVWRERSHALGYVLTVLAVLGTNAYFALISGVTYWTGSRVICPAEATVILAFALLFRKPAATV